MCIEIAGVIGAHGGKLMDVDSQIAVQPLHDGAERQLRDDVCRVRIVAAMQEPQPLSHDARPFDVQGAYVLAGGRPPRA